MLNAFGNKTFMRHHAQGFEQAELVRAYETQETNFTRRMRKVTMDEPPQGANIKRSYTRYKIKHDDNELLSLNARIAPHGKED